MARHNMINATDVKAKIDTTNLLKKITAKEMAMYVAIEAACIRFARASKIYTLLCKSNLFFIFHRTLYVVGFDFAQRLLQ